MKYSTPRLILAASIFSISVSAAFAADPAEIAAHAKSYTAAGEAVLAMVNSKKVDAEAVSKKTDTMIARFRPEFSKALGEGSECSGSIELRICFTLRRSDETHMVNFSPFYQ